MWSVEAKGNAEEEIDDRTGLRVMVPHCESGGKLGAGEVRENKGMAVHSP